MTYIIEKDGTKYEMGASIKEVGSGDAIKVGPGKLEIITKIEDTSGWNKIIVTESGKQFDMLQVMAYGKKLLK